MKPLWTKLPRPQHAKQTRPLRLFWRDNSKQFFEQVREANKMMIESMIVMALSCVIYKWFHDVECWIDA